MPVQYWVRFLVVRDRNPPAGGLAKLLHLPSVLLGLVVHWKHPVYTASSSVPCASTGELVHHNAQFQRYDEHAVGTLSYSTLSGDSQVLDRIHQLDHGKVCCLYCQTISKATATAGQGLSVK